MRAGTTSKRTTELVGPFWNLMEIESRMYPVPLVPVVNGIA